MRSELVQDMTSIWEILEFRTQQTAIFFIMGHACAINSVKIGIAQRWAHGRVAVRWITCNDGVTSEEPNQRTQSQYYL